jgi:CDP-diacylglycerol--glycerol-3-phosphate 3-phosphatidyltransferase
MDATRPSYCESTLTVPNVLTTLRIFMAIVAAVCFAGQTAEKLAVILCVVATLLDAFDGWYARTFAQCSKLGEHLDPLADKLLMAVVYVLIAVKMDSLAVWLLVGLIALREVGMTLFRAYSLRRYQKFIPANRLGKVKMVVQSTVGVAIIACAYLWNDGFDIAAPVVLVPLVVILLISYYSAAVYMNSWMRAKPVAHREVLSDPGSKLQESKRAVVGE